MYDGNGGELSVRIGNVSVGMHGTDSTAIVRNFDSELKLSVL